MKKITIAISMFVVAVMFFAVSAQAATVDRTVSVTAAASITGTTTLSANETTFAYGNPTANPVVPPAGDVFPTTPSTKRVVLTYTSNYNPWKIDVYTNNTQIPLQAVTNGMYAKGGLVSGSGPYSVVPLKWVANNPASAAPTGINFQTSYNFVKDKRDEDDPISNVDDPLTPVDEIANESWDTPLVVGAKTYPGAFSGGYPNVAWGPIPGHSGVCVDPTNATAGVNQYRGENIDGTVAIYVAGLFATGGMTPSVPASAGSYSGTIYFDLYHP